MKRNLLNVSLMTITLSFVLIMLVAERAYAGDHDFKEFMKENGTHRCTDGIDNDFDGLIDTCDPDCTKNRNEKKLLRWGACISNDETPASTDDATTPTSNDAPRTSDPEPYVWPPEGNLLRNPSADSGLNGWFMPYWNRSNYEVNDVVIVDNDPAFYLVEDESRFSEYYLINGANLSQDVKLPLGSAGKFLVLAGYVMTEGQEYPTWDHSNLWSYFMDETYFIEYPTRRSNTITNSLGAGFWNPQWGIFPIPEGIANIRLFMDIHWNEWDDPAGVTGYFDDLEIRVFATQEEAGAFVDGYILAHPEGALRN